MTNEELPINEITPQTESNRRPPITPQILEFDEEGPIPTPEEQRHMIVKWRENIRVKGKQQEKDDERSKKEKERLAKQREAGRLKLQAIKLRREEIELEEKVLRDALEAEDPEAEDRREKGTRDDEDV